MARKKAARGSKMRVAGASAVKSMGLVGALAAALAGGGYYIGKNGSDKIAALMPEKIAALLPAEKPASKSAPAPETKADAKPAESAIVKLADKAELTRLLKGAEAKIVGYVRPEPEKRVKTAKADARKAETSKAETAKTEAVKTDAAKSEAKTDAKTDTKPDAKTAAKTAKTQAKSETAKAQTADADAPVPPAGIPNAGKPVAKADGKTTAKTAEKADTKPAEADAAPASIADALAESSEAKSTKPASYGGGPLGVAITGKGIPTSEDSKIRLSVGFSNQTGRPIRAFEGVLKFTDAQDRSLFSSKISVSALIAEGGTINWDERVDPDKLGKKLVDADKDSLKAVFVPKKVFFVDGSVQQFASGVGAAHLASR